MRAFKFRIWKAEPNTTPFMDYAFDDWYSKALTRPSVFWTVMQFTGKKDKNGQDIYEGDVCEANWPYAKKCVVVWDDSRCGFFLLPVRETTGFGRAAYDKYYKMNANRMTVVGNIYECPIG
jgi:hypothetical protein